MAVAHDAGSESAVSASTASFSWTHTPSGTPRSALVFVLSIQSTGDDTGVTYGGTAMALVAGGEANDTATEQGTVRTYFLDNVAAGAQTVEVTRVNDATQMMGIAATQTAAGATQVGPTIVLLEENGTYAEQSVDDGSPGTASVRYVAGYYGGATPAPVGASTTLVHVHDFTAFGWTVGRETTAGQGARNVGLTQATADDRAGVHLAVREVPPFEPALIAGAYQPEPIDQQAARL